MAHGPNRKMAFISSFRPRKCGIATFTSDLVAATAVAAQGGFEPLGVALRSEDDLTYSDPVKFEIRQNIKRDYASAADYINFSHVDVVSVQHEFGLFGGDAGAHVSLLLDRLKVPVITTLHTLLDEPDPAHHKAIVDVCNASERVITMNTRGVDMLKGIYGINGKKVDLIAHGIPDLPFVDSSYYKHKFDIEGRRTILTFGLLGPNKGIEVMLEAMPAVARVHPSVLYIVLGATHPNVLRQDGESYRFMLQQMVKDLGLQEHVIFHNRFVNDEELHNFLCAADVYVTPYLNREQLTSGTLSFAVGTGKAVVSTPYWAAEELLDDGRGRLVDFGDSRTMAEAVIEILSDDSLFYRLRRNAYDYGRSRTWPVIGRRYWELLNSKHLPVRRSVALIKAPGPGVSHVELPEPSLDYLIRLTDDTGLFQHAVNTIPNRAHGYCTDDNARALICMARYCAQSPEPMALELLTRYLSFVMYAQQPDGSVRNFMSYDRTWLEDEPAHDAFGRTLWAYGAVMAYPPSAEYMSVVKDRFDLSVHLVDRQYPRGMAYSMLGMAEYLRQFPGASDIKRSMATAADQLVAQYEENRHSDWDWFEDLLAYDNGVLPQALYVAATVFDSRRYLEVARRTGDFLLRHTFEGGRFSFVGCNGWYHRGRAKAKFDQQPLEAAATIMMLDSAYQATSEKRFLVLQRSAFDWFLGRNDMGVALYDFRTGGCFDGLTPGGVNLNQGAESVLSFMISLLTVVESGPLIADLTAVQELEMIRQTACESGNP